MPFFLYSVHWLSWIIFDDEARAALRVTAAVLFIRLFAYGGREPGLGEGRLEKDRFG
jgi:hypothetical protein